MADFRALALEPTGFGNVEVSDADKLLVGNIAPSSGNLTIGGASAADGVVIDTGNDLSMSGDGVFNLAGTGNLNITAAGTHAISGGTLDVDVASDFSSTMTLSGGADLVGTSGSTIGTFDAISTIVGGTIGGIVQESLVDKTATELITGQWTFQSANTINPKMIVKAAGGEAADSLLFQVQTSAGANLFSVDVEGDVVIAGGETVAGTTIYTGDITLGDGGNTVQLGSGSTPAVGDNVYINTTGTADGNFSVTTTNFNVATNGDMDTNGDITLTAGGTIGSTANGDIDIIPDGNGEVNITNLAACTTNCNVWVVNNDSAAGTSEYAGGVWLDGDGGTNIEGWRWRNDGSTPNFQLQYKQNPTLATDLTEVWTDIMSATPTAVTVNAPTFNATTGNFTTITGNFTGTIAACGTSCNVWEVNNDAVGTTNEDAGVALPAGDGTNIQNWQVLTDSSAKDLLFRYKQDPTDPGDLAEAGYQLALTLAENGDAQFAGNVGITGTNLSFSTAGTVQSSGGDLTLTALTNDILATAGTVDLQTNVTTLDVPSNTGFSIGGTALTSTLWTATAHDTVFGGPASNADAYHTHSGSGSSCGTTCNQWEINDDAVGTTAEDVGVMFPGGDGTDVQNFQFFNDTSAPEMILRYKQNPTDPADMAEAGYTTILTASSTQVTASVNVDATAGLDVTGAALTVDANGIDSAGNIDLNNTLSFDAAGFIDTSGNNDLTINTGTQDVLVTAGTVDLQTNVTTLDVPSNTGFSIGGTALTTTSFTATAADVIFGDGTGDADPYHTHSTVTSCGTTCNQWEINNDAAGGTAEDVGVMFPGGDGVDVQNFQFFNDTSTPEMVLRYKENPTDPADMAEAGYTTVLQAGQTFITLTPNVNALAGLDVTGAALTVDANGIDSAGNIDLNNTLSFDAAGFIDTSGNNDLTISSGTQDVLVTAGTVDLQTNVTTLDVPSNTGFSIGGTALTTTSFTATAADIIFGDGTGDADPYHTHSSTGAADQVVIDGLTTTAMSQYQAGYVSANDTISPTDCSSGTGTYLTATFAGVYDNTAGEVVNTGKIEVQFDAALVPAPVAGDPAILSWTNSGQYRNRPPATGSGHFFTWAGIVLDASTYGTNQRCVIVIQPGRPVKR